MYEFVTDQLTPNNSGNDIGVMFGGGSKDINPIGSWAYKASNVQPKNDIENAYAGAFVNPAKFF